MLPVTPIGEAIEAADLDRIRDYELDVILRFGFDVVRGGICAAARYGVWSYQPGDGYHRCGTTPLFWEIHRGEPVSAVTLRILSEEGGAGNVIYRSLGATDMTSLQRSRAPIYWKASEFVGRRLRDLASRGFGAIESRDTHAEPADDDRSRYRQPGNLRMLGYLTRVAGRILRNRLANRFYYNLWMFGVRQREDDTLVSPSPERYHLVTPPPGRGYADPFPLERNGRAWVFFEDFGYAGRRRGRISVAELDAQGRLGEVATALERPYHLSYPYVFEWRGEAWMLPETSENRSLELYRAVDFPGRWELEKVIFENVVAVDATLLEHAERWWMFVNRSVAGGGQDDELFVYWSESPVGEWTPLRDNPVVSDVRRARPAGRPFRVDGDLIRPAQDGSCDYGYAIALNRVEVLTESEYRETLFERFTPDWLRMRSAPITSPAASTSRSSMPRCGHDAERRDASKPVTLLPSLGHRRLDVCPTS